MLQQEFGEKRLVVLQLDITSKDETEALRRTIRSHDIEALDIVIANTEIGSRNHPYDPVMGCPGEDMIRTFQTNAMGTLFLAQSMAPLLSMSKRGKLFVSLSAKHASINEVKGVGGFCSYRMSKAATNMACSTFAEDPTVVSFGIRVVCLDPGNVDTSFVSGQLALFLCL
jgi:NAD(P)-dependent dehydrogenase (short-subunit alcohol dehydrogenase family)